MTTIPDPRPCERQCTACHEWKHHSRFRSFKQHSDVKRIRFTQTCRDCEQKQRNERKNADRPRAIVLNRAGRYATKAGVSRDYFMTNMNWQALIPELRAMMTDEGLCTSCGHPFNSGRDTNDIQFEHREPPRHHQDWARQHARNIAIACASCNQTKRNKPYAQWLDEQEQCRLSNEADRTVIDGLARWVTSLDPEQGTLF